MEDSNGIPKIGIFGWSGTGKTIYISMLHYLFSEKKHTFVHNSHIINASNGTYNDKIEDNVNIFLKNKDWENVTNEIKGSINTSNLLFNIDTNEGSHEFEIQDYRGEDIARQEDKESEDKVYEYFLNCNALLLFLDAEAFEEKELVANRERWREIQKLLDKLNTKSKSQKIKTPIYLVITKKDVLDFNDKGEIAMPSSEIKEKYNSMLRTISQYSESTKPFFISSKSCFDYYIKNKGKEEHEAHEFCTPILRGLKEAIINQKNKQNEEEYNNKIKDAEIIREDTLKIKKEKEVLIKNILKKAAIAVSGIILIYSLFLFNYNNTLAKIENNGSDVSDLEDFLRKTPFGIFPNNLKETAKKLLTEKRKKLNQEAIEKKIRVTKEKLKKGEELFTKIRSYAEKEKEKDYKTIFTTIKDLKDGEFTYDDKELNSIIFNMELDLIQNIQNSDITDEKRLKLIKDFNEFFSIEEVLNEISSLEYNNFKKILKHESILRKIKATNSDNYKKIIPLCKEYDLSNNIIPQEKQTIFKKV